MRQPETSDERLWRWVLTTGGVFGLVFLVLQLSDYWNDAAHPAMRRNDLTSAAASVALLAIVAVIAARRAQIRKQASQAAASPGRARATPAKKRRGPAARRKRRA